MLKKYREAILKEFKTHKYLYIVLTSVIIGAFLLRIYRTGDLLNFYYDQGRDGLVIWRLWHEGRPFLIGPVTGLAGIFLGPFYYYLIAPFYLIGGGNPVIPAYFLAFLSTCAIVVIYYLGNIFHSRTAGLIAAVIGTFSYRIILAGRWLANPTPILLTSLILLFSMWQVSLGKDKRWWIVISLLIGISLQLEAASAVFYLPMILVFTVWQRKNIPDKKTLFISVGIFLLTLIPQIIFNFRHENILLDNFKKVIIEEKSFKLFDSFILNKRVNFFWSVFRNKIFPEESQLAVIFYALLGFLLFISRKNIKKPVIPLLGIFLITPMVGILLFQGNLGNIYDYYLTGYYLPFVLIFAITLGEVWKKKVGKWLVISFLAIFMYQNIIPLGSYFNTGKGGPTAIALGNELQAVNWIFDDAKQRGDFNVDVYVPPVIPHSYDYLFLWQGTKRCGDSLCGLEKEEMLPLLYTLYEVDPPHPWRLTTWLERQKGIGEVEKEIKFDGITVQRRRRIKYN